MRWLFHCTYEEQCTNPVHIELGNIYCTICSTEEAVSL
uniref:Uncharacterized protein n=1 Tax=Arundo donax TaxID=35708 RepID=A0A0A9SDE6_ARUDO